MNAYPSLTILVSNIINSQSVFKVYTMINVDINEHCMYYTGSDVLNSDCIYRVSYPAHQK